jgi:hypothetical protein
VLPPGSHELAVRFQDRLDDLSLDGVVDLEIDDGGCLRVPGDQPERPSRGRKAVRRRERARVRVQPGHLGLRGIYDFHAGAGAWVGPLLLTGQVGVGASLCNEVDVRQGR